LLLDYGAEAWQVRYCSVQRGPAALLGTAVGLESLWGVGLGPEASLKAVQILVTFATLKRAVLVTKTPFVSLPVTLSLSEGSADLMPDLALQSARELLHQLQEPVRGWTAKVAVVKLEKCLFSVVFQHCPCCRTRLVHFVHFLNVAGEGLADLEKISSLHFRCHVALRCPFEGLVVLAVGRVEQAALAVPQVRVYQSMLERYRHSPEF